MGDFRIGLVDGKPVVYHEGTFEQYNNNPNMGYVGFGKCHTCNGIKEKWIDGTYFWKKIIPEFEDLIDDTTGSLSCYPVEPPPMIFYRNIFWPNSGDFTWTPLFTEKSSVGIIHHIKGLFHENTIVDFVHVHEFMGQRLNSLAILITDSSEFNKIWFL